MNTTMVKNFQRAAADTLQSMIKVLKDESSAGKNYEALLDGARSLTAGLGGMLKVSSYGAREYETRDTHQLYSENSENSRSKRDAELLQAKNEVQQCDIYHGFLCILRSN